MNHEIDRDVLIVGSGFGGAVCALRAAEAGLGVTVLERGRRMSPRTCDALAHGRLPLTGRAGLLDVKVMKGLACLSANGLGGTSNLYTAVTVRPPTEIFESGWPPGWNGATLDPHLDQGPPVTAWIDLWHRQRVYLMETGPIPFGLPSLGLSLALRAWPRRPRPEPRGVRRSAWSFAVMGHCDGPATIVLRRGEALAHLPDARPWEGIL